jgi:acyl-[acyl-carrier-protein]-phospholipid O-acyltransferase/long-chain-fatty-acid--[acyl-carrier-protein] ligase
MVPLESVEQKIISVLLAGEQSERVFAIVGVADQAKGEAIVLLSSIEVDLPQLRVALADLGVPNLWIPRVLRRVNAIPVLGSGKLDLVGCKLLAEQEE